MRTDIAGELVQNGDYATVEDALRDRAIGT